MNQSAAVKLLVGKYPISKDGAQQIISDFVAGEELDVDMYDILFGHFCYNGEMPYGTATAKDGDPYQWVNDKIADDLGAWFGNVK